MARKDETPGVRAERERLERLRQDEQDLARQRRKESHEAQKRRVQEAREYRKREAEREAQREIRGQSGAYGRSHNEAAVVEYLRRNPNATNKDIAFHAIYGGGPVAFEGLHRKTQAQARAEASRVLARLQGQGVIRQSGWTGGGRALWDVTPDAPETDPSLLRRWFGTPPDKMKSEERDKPRRGGRGRGSGVFEEASRTDDDEPSGGRGGGKGYGIFSEATDDNSGGDDDEGGGSGLFKKV